MATSLVLTDVESLRRAISETKDANKRKDGEIERLKATLAKMAEKSMPKEAPVVVPNESSDGGGKGGVGRKSDEPRVQPTENNAKHKQELAGTSTSTAVNTGWNARYPQAAFRHKLGDWRLVYASSNDWLFNRGNKTCPFASWAIGWA